MFVTQSGCSGFDGGLGWGDTGATYDLRKKDTSAPKSSKVTQSQNSLEGYHVINTENIEFNSATDVMSKAEKVIIFIPEFKNNGEPAVYPSEDPKAGEHILDYEGKPIYYNGFVFVNPKDKCYQVAKGDGTGVIIINQGTEEQKLIISKKIKDLSNAQNQDNVSSGMLRELIAYMEKVGIKDFYNSDRTYVETHLTDIEKEEKNHVSLSVGLFKRNDIENQQSCKAVYVPGRIAYKGKAAATPQKFENGGIIVQHGKDIRGVQLQEFIETYRLPDGSKIKLSDLKEYSPVNSVK